MRHRHHHEHDFDHDFHPGRGERHGHRFAHGDPRFGWAEGPHRHERHGASRGERFPRGLRGWHPERFFDASFLHGLWHAIGRHGHRHHGGGHGFWGGRGFGGGDDDGLTRGRKFSGEDLQLMLLALIAEAPRHGYELIKALETRSNGFYTPSPGMVYPALTYLEELGYVSVQQEGNRKRYEISETGRAHLDAQRDRVDIMLAKLAYVAQRMEAVRRAYAADDETGGEGSETGRWHPKLMQARYAIKLALLRHIDASEDEQRRIAEILLRAAAEIDGKNGPAPQGSAAPTADV